MKTMTQLYNTQKDKLKRRYLRRHMTSAEYIMWNGLKNRRLNGYKFRRQYSIDGFVIDFYCPEKKLAVEIDGGSHFSKDARGYDREREKLIESLGIKILRFTNNQVFEDINRVVEEILIHILPSH